MTKNKCFEFDLCIPWEQSPRIDAVTIGDRYGLAPILDLPLPEEGTQPRRVRVTFRDDGTAETEYLDG